MQQWKQQAQRLKRDIYALYFACRDNRMPWYAKLVAAVVIAYAFSPIDLIPDFIPILGYLDDLVLVPLGVAIVFKLIPSTVMKEAREQARIALEAGMKKPVNRNTAYIIVGIWISLGLGIITFVLHQKFK